MDKGISTMAMSENFSEDECFNVYWKIKNFSFCYEAIRSPLFSNSSCFMYQYDMLLRPMGFGIECKISNSKYPNYFQLKTLQVSFLTCDGSPEESISGNADVCLKVAKDVIYGSRRSSLLPEDTLTVRLRIPTNSGRGKVFICSQIAVKCRHFLWTCEDISTNSCNREKHIENFDRYGDIKLILKTMGGINSTEQFSMEISHEDGTVGCYCVLKISVLDVDGKSEYEVSDEFFLQKKEGRQEIRFPSIIKKSKWIACKNLLLKEDKLTLKCFFAITLGTVSAETADISHCETATSLQKESDHISTTFLNKNQDPGSISELSTDLNKILQNETLCDTHIKIGSEVIKVHKSILIARSPVFKAMFTKDMKEKNNNTVVIEDLDADTMRRLLLYMYTDTIIHDEWENTKELYIAANKYEVLSLKKKCASFLKANLSVPNVCEALVFADLHEDESLKTIVHDFISECDSAVFYSEEWAQLEKNNSALVFRTMREICCSKRFK